jgi:imidazolonepropionase
MKILLIKNIGLLATPLGSAARSGAAQGEIRLLRDAWVRVEDGVIAAVGSGAPEVPAGAGVLDAGGKLVTPGLVDAHTHLVFGGWRQNELALKLRGVPYLDILAQGGGILSTVTATRAASQEELAEKARAALDEMLSFGTTTCEAKSGYGLDTETELRQLRAIRALDGTHPVDLVPTFLGAHALPQEYRERRAEYVRLLCEEMIPAAAAEGLARFCDVFCETGVFTAEESRTILEAGKQHGLRPKIHADEIDAIGGSRLAGEIGAASAEHLIACPPEGIASMAKGGTVACLLPCTSFYLGAAYAPAREMVGAGVPVAMATDFNPGSCPCLNMQLVMNLGCLKYRLTPEEVLTAVTLNGAAAIGMAESVGSVEPGKLGDLVIWEAEDLNYICYRMGSSLARTVVKRGKIYENTVGRRGPGGN